MAVTSVISLKLPKIKTVTTVFRELLTDRSPLPVEIALPQETDYTEAQFSADLKKASKKLDAMVKKALEDDAQGKTRDFPV